MKRIFVVALLFVVSIVNGTTLGKGGEIYAYISLVERCEEKYPENAEDIDEAFNEWLEINPQQANKMNEKGFEELKNKIKVILFIKTKEEEYPSKCSNFLKLLRSEI